jgi:putative ABC transport system permease protein
LLGKAIDVEKELSICPRITDSLVAGEFLTADDRNSILLTEATADNLKIKIGDTMLLFAISEKGAINATELILKGLFKSPLPDSSKKLGYIPLQTAQDLLLMNGKVTEVVIKKDKQANVDEIANQIKAGLTETKYETSTWREIEQIIVQMVERQGFLGIVVSVILFVIVFSTVMNTMLMVVLERTSEIGTLMAIGFRENHILALFVYEGTMKGLIGGTIGTLLGSLAVVVLNMIGIRLSLPGEDITFILRPEIDGRLIIFAFIFSIGAAILASLYPANRGAKLNPVEALRST